MAMALNFFAADDDLTEVVSWLFQVPGMKFFEEYSAPDQQNRWFERADEVTDRLKSSPHMLAAWPSDVGGKPKQKAVRFNKELQDEFGGTGRTILESPAIIRVRRVTEIPECINPFSISCWTEKGARQRSNYDEKALDSVDWSRLTSIVASIERRIKKTSPGRLNSQPILPGAYKRLVDGDAQIWAWGKKVGSRSSLIKATNVR